MATYLLNDEKQILLRATVESKAWTALLERRSGWRLSDLGKTIALPDGRSVWFWGDSWTTDSAEGLKQVRANTIAVSGDDPSQPINFYGRVAAYHPNGEPDPTNGVAIDISDGDGVAALRNLSRLDPDHHALGGWEWTGNEGHPVVEQVSWLWPSCGAALDSLLVLICAGFRSPCTIIKEGPCSYWRSGRNTMVVSNRHRPDPDVTK